MSLPDPLSHLADISAFTNAKNNAELIVLAHQLGHITDSDLVLDVTYGRGTWYKRYRPASLITNDLSKGNPDMRFDFRSAPFPDQTFDVVAYDPPYRLNGTPALGEMDDRFGTDSPTPWKWRMELIHDGFIECCRITKRGGKVLAKVQDQVCSGKVRWQTMMLWKAGEENGMRLVDELHLGGGRKQPEGRKQVHARHDFSTLQIYTRIQ